MCICDEPPLPHSIGGGLYCCLLAELESVCSRLLGPMSEKLFLYIEVFVKERLVMAILLDSSAKPGGPV